MDLNIQKLQRIQIVMVLCSINLLNKLIDLEKKLEIIEEELGSSDESGKDWSDLEREAAEEDRDRNEFQDEYSKKKMGSSGGSRFNSSSSHKKSSSDKHRYRL